MKDALETIQSPNDIETFCDSWNKRKPNEEQKNKRNFIYQNNTLVYEDNYIFTEPQKSGSCAWYSIYWSIFLLCLVECQNQDLIFETLENLSEGILNDFEKLLMNNNSEIMSFLTSQYDRMELINIISVIKKI